MVIASEEFEGLRRNSRVSSAVRKADGVHVRVVSADPPTSRATQAEPTLEDAFLFTMSRQAAA